ncbi:hypothetical protein LCGC14_2099420 [marine sediment metagenome]|uniref:Uncharacterized protein n=1 Tax=marine sediment metagenome TaxID=412755 RepID=A0A0F9GNI5_9ZZZZ|nr:hypothetical protein [Candidatus Scalindua sp.]
MKVYIPEEEGEIFARLQVKGEAMQSLYLKEVNVSEDKIVKILRGPRIGGDSMLLAKRILNLLK